MTPRGVQAMRSATVLLLTSLATALAAQPHPARAAPPAWAAKAIWYQVFVERFRNGDPANDPTPHDMEEVTDEPTPAGWQVTPWGHDWYRQEAWERATGKGFYGTVQFRRYGGDLQGVLDRLDYLQQLGVTALFLNPINDAPSLHKYDARSYAHIDRNFGPDPRGDERLIAGEEFANPATWHRTAADSLFLVLVREVHRRGMRIIIDYSWNHTGIAFPAWKDVLRRQRQSPYADWYEVERFDDPATPDTNEFRYRGWAGVPWLPEWKKVGRPAGKTAGPIEGTLVPGVRDMIFAVTRRWLDPDGDGDPRDGVDGFRLDVADVIPLGFWREYRTFVRGINPEAYLVGEIWWEHWPDKLWDPTPWLKGDVFDAVMHYQWFTPTRQFLADADPPLTASAYASQLDSMESQVAPAFRRSQMNLTASHDTPRFATAIANRGVNKFRANPRDDSTYHVGPADALTQARQRLILAQQFTWIGAPHIWNGDEVGMWGADDPDERKPIVWGDLAYETEVAHPFGRARPPAPVAPDTALLRTYRELIALRRAHARLFAEGAVAWRVVDDAHRVLAYSRMLGREEALVLLNAGSELRRVTVQRPGRWMRAWPAGKGSITEGPSRSVTLAPFSAQVWIRR